MARGGSYTYDPETGETKLVACTQEGPLPDPPPDPPAAPALAPEPPPAPADAVAAGEAPAEPAVADAEPRRLRRVGVA